MRRWKNTFHANGKQKKAGVAILISDKIDFKDYKRKGMTQHNDQGINPRGRQNNCKYLCTQQRSTSIHKTNTIRRKLDSREIDSNTITPHSHQQTDHQNLKLMRKHKS